MRSKEISLKLNMWLFQFAIVHFVENPTLVGPVVPTVWAIEGVSKQKKAKEMHLTNNAPDFCQITLDRNTNGIKLLVLLYCIIWSQVYSSQTFVCLLYSKKHKIWTSLSHVMS